MNGIEEILEDVLKQYQRVGYQTQVLRLKNTGEVLVSLRMGRVIANMKISMRDQIELRKLHDMTEQDVLFIAGYVAGSGEIDELSFRQRVDENYKETYHLHELLTKYHKKLWRYITQSDYNLYFHNGRVYTKYTDIFTEGKE